MYCETELRGFESQVVTYRPSIWKFIDGLRREEALIRLDHAAQARGEMPPRKTKKSAQISARVLKMVEEYNNRETKEYLKAIAYNFSF